MSGPYRSLAGVTQDHHVPSLAGKRATGCRLEVWRILLTAVALVGCAAGAHATQQSGTVARPFVPIETRVATPLGPEVMLAQPVQVDVDLLSRQVVGDWIDLSASAAEPLEGVVQRVQHRAPRRFTLAGSLEGHSHGSFILVVYEDVATGVIRMPEAGALCQLRFTSAGVHLLQWIDTAAYPPEQCDPGRAVPGGPAPDAPILAPDDDSAPPAERGDCVPLAPVYDVLMVYTSAARQAMGSTNAAIAQCQLAVEVGNEAYVNSEIDVRLRLAHTMETTYDEPGDQEDWLDWLTGSPTIAAARNDSGADFVNMLTSGGSGVGWCGPNSSHAYTCAKWDRAVNTWTLVHELGHNQGCDHNREDSGGDCAYYSYGYGHHFTGASGTEFGSVMSYLGTRVAHFSNPDIDFDGVPTGVPIGETGEAHCARIHNIMDYTCERFRPSRYDVWVDFSNTAACNWYKGKHSSFLANGIDGIWNDLNEPDEPYEDGDDQQDDDDEDDDDGEEEDA